MSPTKDYNRNLRGADLLSASFLSLLLPAGICFLRWFQALGPLGPSQVTWTRLSLVFTVQGRDESPVGIDYYLNCSCIWLPFGELG